MSERELLEALYRDMQSMKDDMPSMKGDLQEVKDRTSKLELTLENETNRNIQLLAENHINLVDKLNEAISVQNKSILYEVQVSGLKMRVDKLEQEVKEIKSQIA